MAEVGLVRFSRLALEVSQAVSHARGSAESSAPLNGRPLPKNTSKVGSEESRSEKDHQGKLTTTGYRKAVGSGHW